MHQFQSTLIGEGLTLRTPNAFPSVNGSAPLWNIDGTVAGWSNDAISANGLGALPSATAAINTAAIQAAINSAVAAGGGTVSILKAGTYMLASAGNHPYDTGTNPLEPKRYCLIINGNYVTIYIGEGVTLKLDNAEMVGNTASVDGIIFRDRVGIRLVGASPEASFMDWNVSGQPGWLEGYRQGSVAGSCIHGQSTAGNGNNGVVVYGLRFQDCFSCPVNIGGSGGADRSNRNTTLDWLEAEDCGEGLQVYGSVGVKFNRLRVLDPSGVCVGDAIEPSSCTNVKVTDCYVWQPGTNGGAAIDIGGSENVIVDGLTCDKWGSCVGIGYDSFGGMTNNIRIVNLIALNPAKGQVIGNSTGNGVNCVFDGVEVDCTDNPETPAFTANLSATLTYPPLIINNLTSVAGKGVRVSGASDVQGHNWVIEQSRNPGIEIFKSTGTPNIYLTNSVVRDSLSWGLRINGAFAPTGRILNCNFSDNNALGAITTTNSGDASALEFRGTLPSNSTATIGSAQLITGVESLNLYSGMKTLSGGFDGQEFTIRIEGEAVPLPDASLFGNFLIGDGITHKTYYKNTTLRFRRSASQDRYIKAGGEEFPAIVPATTGRSLSGSGQYFSSVVNLTNMSAGSANRSFLIWALETTGTGTAALMSFGNTSNWNLAWGGVSTLTLTYRDIANVQKNLNAAGIRPAAGTWHQVCWVHRQGSYVATRVNKGTLNTQAETGGLKAANDPRIFTLGATASFTNLLNGGIALFLDYADELTTVEMDAIHDGKPRTLDDLDAILDISKINSFNILNEATVGSPSYDRSFGGLTLTAVGSVGSMAGPV